MQNKKFCIKLKHPMLQWIYITLSIFFILYLLLHMKMKKILVGAFLWMFAVAWVAVLPNYVNAEGESGGDGGDTSTTDTTNFNKGWWQGQNSNTDYNPSVAGSTKLQNDSLINVIKTAINWVLWMLSLVALAIALYAWFLMMTSGGDEKKYSKWVGLLKWAGIWLAIIALSWLIVSLIFWIINGAIGNNTTTADS